MSVITPGRINSLVTGKGQPRINTRKEFVVKTQGHVQTRATDQTWRKAHNFPQEVNPLYLLETGRSLLTHNTYLPQVRIPSNRYTIFICFHSNFLFCL